MWSNERAGRRVSLAWLMMNEVYILSRSRDMTTSPLIARPSVSRVEAIRAISRLNLTISCFRTVSIDLRFGSHGGRGERGVRPGPGVLVVEARTRRNGERLRFCDQCNNDWSTHVARVLVCAGVC